MPDDRKGNPRIRVTKNGPYVVSGSVPLAEETIVVGRDGEPAKWDKAPSFPDQETYSLCRCGASKDKPFCDGAHVAAGFKAKPQEGQPPPKTVPIL